MSAAAHSANRPYSSGRTSQLAESDLSSLQRQADCVHHGAVDFPFSPIGKKEICMTNSAQIHSRDGLRRGTKSTRLFFDERFQIKARFSVPSVSNHFFPP